MRSAPGDEPKVNTFWFITRYGDDHHRAVNPIDRYAVGDRAKGLQRDRGRRLTIDVQADSRSADKESNGLPWHDLASQ